MLKLSHHYIPYIIKQQPNYISCTSITPTWRQAVAAVSKMRYKIPLSWRSLLFSFIYITLNWTKFKFFNLNSSTNTAPSPFKVTSCPFSEKLYATLESLGLQVLPRPQYSPGLASSEFHILWFLQAFIRYLIVENEEEVSSTLDSFFLLKKCFYSGEINILVKKWNDEISLNGKYLI